LVSEAGDAARAGMQGVAAAIPATAALRIKSLLSIMFFFAFLM
jgi:hypothetical protein